MQIIAFWRAMPKKKPKTTTTTTQKQRKIHARKKKEIVNIEYLEIHVHI